ncbi:hypothetical protein [Micromonospora sp. M51]|uniref:hypothetical protein n=1 Tax=Micromonospora sp. M51 TaxID=2824889 RepID=UPI001FFD1FCD|nr:hypothetical protein [Micromonospora sp. M51]
MTAAERCEEIVKAIAGYRATVPGCYDEPLHEVIERVQRSGSLGKVDIGALYLWKRIPQGRWGLKLLTMPEAQVRGITATAVQAARDEDMPIPDAAEAARKALSPLPGMRTGDALPSALILAAAPDRMAVYDRRARKGLAKVCLPLGDGPRRYRRYMELVERCRVELDEQGAGTHTAREVDLALYWLGG